MSFFFPGEPSAQNDSPKPQPSAPRLMEVLGPYLDPVILQVLNSDSPKPKPSAETDPVKTFKDANLRKVLVAAAQAPLPLEAPKTDLCFSWLAFYLEGAVLAAEESVQQLWGCLLANEIHDPGAVSKRTLQFLKTMDPWEVEAFAEFAAFSFSFESGWHFMIENESAHREMWSYGREIDMTQHWIDIGLLAPEVSVLESAKLRGLRMSYRKKKSWALSIAEHDQGESFLYRKFTALGQQLSDGLRLKVFTGFARNLVKSLNETSKISFEELDMEAS